MRAAALLSVSGLLMLALSVAACQPNSSKPASSAAAAPAPATTGETAGTSSSKPGGGKWKTTGVFDARLEAATQKMMSNAFNACLNGGGAEMMDCVSGELALAIDPSGSAKDHCAGQPDVDAQFQCAFAGTVVMKIREKSGVEMSDGTWTNYEKAMQEELLAVGIHESFACAKVHGPKGADFRECMSESILSKMDANPEMGQPCLTLEPDEKFGQCVGEAGLVSLLEAAAGRAT